MIDESFHDSILASYKTYARWSNAAVRLVLFSVALVLSPRKRSVRYFFWGTKNERLILSLDRKETCVIGGPLQLIFCLRHRRQFLPCTTLIGNIWVAFVRGLCNQPRRNDALLQNSISRFRRSFQIFSAPHAALVLNNDSLPMQRMLILAVKTTNISRTICIQHGIYQSKSHPSVVDGRYCDIFLSLHEYQKSILIEKGIQESKIRVVNFFSSAYNPVRQTATPGTRKIMFIGQPWFKYGPSRSQRYLEIVNRLNRLLCDNQLRLFYKPHPWEVGSPYLSALHSVINISLIKAIEDYDVFVSFTSTVLLEVRSAGRVSIQLYDPIFDCDDFSIYDGVLSIPTNHNDFDNIFLRMIQAPSPASKPVKDIAMTFKLLTGDEEK